MARLEWSEHALAALEQLVSSHSLSADTRERVEESAEPLRRFPLFGPELGELAAGESLRFLIGPWPWLVIVYVYLESEDRVVLVSVEDGRAATAIVTRARKRPPPG